MGGEGRLCSFALWPCFGAKTVGSVSRGAAAALYCAFSIARSGCTISAVRAPPLAPATRRSPAGLSPPPPVQPPQVRFFQVSEEELEDLRERFDAGQYDINIEAKTFSLRDYNKMISGGLLGAGRGPGRGSERVIS